MIRYDCKWAAVQGKWRAKRGLSLRELSKRTTYSKGTLHKYEQGVRVPPWDVAWVIIHALGIPLNQVMPDVPKTILNLCAAAEGCDEA